MKVSIVVPCYNEEKGLTVMLPQIPEFIDEVIIVNNNSTDKTVEIANYYKCTVLHEKTKGYGAAYKCGFKYNQNDIIVTMDADDTYPIEEIEKNVNNLLNMDYDFISCSRFPLKNKKSMNRSNIIGNKILTIESKIIFGYRLLDSQTGMWVFKKRVFDYIFPESDGMPLSQEIKLLAIMNKNIRFYESHINYRPRIGEVKLQKWNDGFKNMFQLIKMRLKS